MATYNCFAIARGTYSGEIDASKSNNLIQSAKEAAECAYCGENKKMHIYISPIMSPTVKNRYKFTATIVLMLEGKMSARSQKEAFDLYKEQCKDRNFGLLKDVFFENDRLKQDQFGGEYPSCLSRDSDGNRAEFIRKRSKFIYSD